MDADGSAHKIRRLMLMGHVDDEPTTGRRPKQHTAILSSVAQSLIEPATSVSLSAGHGGSAKGAAGAVDGRHLGHGDTGAVDKDRRHLARLQRTPLPARSFALKYVSH